MLCHVLMFQLLMYSFYASLFPVPTELYCPLTRGRLSMDSEMFGLWNEHIEINYILSFHNTDT